MINLNSYRISELPDTAYYIPSFINEQEEQIIFNQVYKAPKLKWIQQACAKDPLTSRIFLNFQAYFRAWAGTMKV